MEKKIFNLKKISKKIMIAYKMLIIMRNMTLYKLILVLALSLSIRGIMAQPGNNKVIIQGKFTPSINDATKINTTPSLRDTVYKTPKFTYKIEERKLETPFRVAPIRPARLLGEPLNKLYANYVALGMGNYLTPFFEFYHSKLRSRSTKYGVHIKHMSSAGSIKDYAFPAWSHNLVEFYGSKFWRKSVFDMNISYQRKVSHFYGFKPRNYPDSILPKDVDIVQRYNLAQADFHWYRYRLRRSEMNYDIKLKYYFTNDFYRNKEHGVIVNSFYDWNSHFVKKFKNERIGFELKNHFYDDIWDTLNGQISNIIDLMPYYKFDFGPLSVKAGIDMQVVTDSMSNAYFFPNISINLAAIPDVLYFNFNLTGGYYRNSLKSFSEENPFIISHIPVGFTNRKFQTNFGLGSSISKAVNFDIQLYYDKFEHAPLFVTDTNSLYDNKFTVVYDDYDRLKLQMGMTYRLHQKVQLLLRGNYYVYNMTNELFPWHKPAYDVSLTANYNIQDKILLKAAFITYGSSHAPVWENGLLKAQTLKSWVDINFGVEYRYRKKTSIFINFNNITSTRYYRWYNYPSYRFNILGGFSYIF